MDLLSDRPLWPWRDGLPASFPRLERSTTCDVAIVGAGITGSILAQALAAEGRDVVVLDGREVAHGSTAGNTGLVLYELDVPLHRLARTLGLERAERAFARCRAAVGRAREVARESRIDCGFTAVSNLYLAARAGHVPALERDFNLRRAAGHDITWWDRARIRAESSLLHHAAVLSQESMQVDAYRWAYGLLLAAQANGARVHERTTVTRWRAQKRGVTLRTNTGADVRARWVVMATGYEAAKHLRLPGVALQSTFALATQPMTTFEGWPRQVGMMWDTGSPYLYLRTTGDGRVIIGGYDEPFQDAARRDRMLGAKVASLKRRLRQFFPAMRCEVATAWAGTFGVSADGLPFIGQHPDLPHTWLALGFGGNGTTFSLIAAELISRALRGERDPDADLFGFERLSSPLPSPGAR